MFHINLVFKILPRLSERLSNSFFQTVRLYLKFLLFLISKKLHKKASPWRFEFYFEGKELRIKLFEGSPDIAALAEIFLDGEYDWDSIKEPQIIIDLGAHTGNTALYFHAKYPNAVIYAVEASPQTFSHLLENVHGIAQIKPIFGAISDRNGKITFYESESSLGSSIYKRANSVGVEVPTFTLDSLFLKEGLGRADFIKIDIEGGEGDIFLRDLPEKYAEWYIVEVHSDLMTERVDFIQRFFAKYETLTKSLATKDRYLLYAKATITNEITM